MFLCSFLRILWFIMFTWVLCSLRCACHWACTVHFLRTTFSSWCSLEPKDPPSIQCRWATLKNFENYNNCLFLFLFFWVFLVGGGHNNADFTLYACLDLMSAGPDRARGPSSCTDAFWEIPALFPALWATTSFWWLCNREVPDWDKTSSEFSLNWRFTVT